MRASLSLRKLKPFPITMSPQFKSLFNLSSSSAASYSTTSSSSNGSEDIKTTMTMKKKIGINNKSYLLGPLLPDIWIPHSNSIVSSQNHHIAQENGVLTPKIIDGNSIAKELRTVITEEVVEMKNSMNKVPGLAVILVGNRRDSASYVRFKRKACHEVGIKSVLQELPADCSENEVIDAIASFNEDPTIHGILVQLPLPQHIDVERILNAVKLEKDVDGFHPVNVGNLAMNGGEPMFIPCAAKACMELLLRSGIELMGKNVAVIGRSRVVGLPVSSLLQRHHATVFTVHAFTKDPEEITNKADIVISAAGVPNLVRKHWLKHGSVVIDVGTNPVEDQSSEHGYYLTGDVCYEEALQVVSAITPVPGGVGPVTIAMLLLNTLDSAKNVYGLQ